MRNRANRVFPLALLALAVLPYCGSFWNGFTIDDFFTYADNMFVRDWRHWPDLFDHAYFAGSNEASYRPLCTATYFTDWSLWRQWPGGPHVTNVALYAATVLALFALFRRLTASPLAAFCGSALFALHPLHTEVVNSLSFREDLLVSLFVTLSWLAYDRGRRGRAWCWLPLAWGCYALATLSKEAAIVFPALALVLAWVAAARGERHVDRDPAHPVAPVWRALTHPALLAYATGLAALTILFLLLRFRWMHFPLEGREPQLGGSLVGSLLADVRIQAHYLRLLAIPTPLSAYYPPDAYAIRFDGGFAVASAILAAVGAACWLGRRSVLFLSAVAWWFISLAPVANLYPIYNPMAERYTYLASIGPCWWAGTLLARGWESRHRRAVGLASAGLALIWGALIVARNPVWRNDLTLWNSVLRHAPADPVVLANLAAAKYASGDYDRAAAFSRLALDCDPSAYPNFSPASAQLPLACVALSRGQTDEALALLHTIERQLPLRFDLDSAVHQNLAQALEAKGDLAGALNCLEQAARLEPYRDTIWAKAAHLRLLLDQPARAREDWARARRLNPRLPAIEVLESEMQQDAATRRSTDEESP